MYNAIAYGLLYVSVSFYCGIDVGLKEKAAIYSYISRNSTSDELQCAVMDCMTKALKLYDSERGKLTEEGFVLMTAALSEFNEKVVDTVKKELNRCIPEVNEKINSLPFYKCTKFDVGFSLLQACVDKKKIDLSLGSKAPTLSFH